jgi:hypothetical protein
MENYNAVFIEQKGNDFASVYFDDVNSKHKREMSIEFDGSVLRFGAFPGEIINGHMIYFTNEKGSSPAAIASNLKDAMEFLKGIISVIRSGGQVYVGSNECGKSLCMLSRTARTYEISAFDISVLEVTGLVNEKAMGFDFDELSHLAFCKAMCLQMNQFAGLEGLKKSKQENTSLFANLHLLDDGVYKLSKCFESRERAFEIAKRQTSYVKTVEIKM